MPSEWQVFHTGKPLHLCERWADGLKLSGYEVMIREDRKKANERDKETTYTVLARVLSHPDMFRFKEQTKRRRRKSVSTSWG